MTALVWMCRAYTLAWRTAARAAVLAAAVITLAGCPNDPERTEPGQACSTAGATSEGTGGQLLVCRGGRWEPA